MDILTFKSYYIGIVGTTIIIIIIINPSCKGVAVQLPKSSETNSESHKIVKIGHVCLLMYMIDCNRFQETILTFEIKI